jgi:hypothetical protein
MDLAKLDTVQAANEGFEVRLYNPHTNEDLDIFITVLGRDSDAYRSLFNKHQRRRVERMTKGGRVGSVSPEAFEQDAIELLAVCTKSWRTGDKPVLLINGEEMQCSRDNAVHVYKKYPWIKEQVDDAVSDRANFLKR